MVHYQATADQNDELIISLRCGGGGKQTCRAENPEDKAHDILSPRKLINLIPNLFYLLRIQNIINNNVRDINCVFVIGYTHVICFKS